MSHRLRDQSSSATSIRFGRPQAHPSPASASVSRSGRFTRPSSSHDQPVSTPGTSIARFRNPARLKDEIETSFEEADQSSPRLPSRSRFSSSVSRGRDVIDDLEDDDGDGLRGNESPPRSRRGAAAEVEDGGLADLEFLERLRGTRASARVRDHDTLTSSSEESDNPATPAASRKRRRLENRTDHDSNWLEAGEHQAEHIALHRTTGSEQDDGLEEASSDSDLPSSPLASASASAHPPGVISSRFRLSNPTSLHHTTPTSTAHRPSFRPQPDHLAASVTLPVHLPIAFSPSRRRGGRGREYLPGGAADTVRNWILGLGAAEEQVQRRGQGVRSVEKVEVAETVGREGGAGFSMVKDKAGRRWVLVGAEGTGTADGSVLSNTARKRIGVGRTVGVKMGWDVTLSGDGADGQDRHGDCGNEEVWKIAVLWDVLGA